MIGFFAVAAAVAVLVAMGKCGFLKCFVFSAVSGVGALFAIHFTSLMTAVSVPVTAASIAGSALGGIPAVAAMLVMRMF